MPKNQPTEQPEVQLTIMEAASYANTKEQTVKNALASPTWSNIFTNATAKREFPGTRHKPVVVVNKSAIDAWLEARKSTPSGKGFQRKSARNGKILQIANVDWQKVSDAVAAVGYTLVPAFTGKPAKPAPTDNGSSNGVESSPPVETPQDADLVEA